MNFSFLYSLVGHILLGVMLFVSFPFSEQSRIQENSEPILIDLRNIEISEKTNIPEKTKKKVQNKVATAKKYASNPSKKQPKTSFASEQKKQKKEEVKPIQNDKNIKKDAAKILDKTPKKIAEPKKIKKKPIKEKKNILKEKKISPPKKVVFSQKIQDDGMDSLLASIEKMKNSPSIQNSSVEKNSVSDLISGVLNGVANGQAKGIDAKLTVSQVDFIAAKLRLCWSRPAASYQTDIKIGLLVRLSKDGQVLNVKSTVDLDKKFESLVESAKRAVYICDKKGGESPFRMLALKYPQKYSQWQEMKLFFNPSDGEIY